MLGGVLKANAVDAPTFAGSDDAPTSLDSAGAGRLHQRHTDEVSPGNDDPIDTPLVALALDGVAD